MATLADAASCALRHVRDVDAGHIARFPDSVAWAAAAAPVLGFDPAAILDSVSDPESMWLGADPLRDTLYTLLRLTHTWSGDSSMLLTQLRAIAPLATLPTTPQGLDQSLARIPGISLARHRRILTISKVTPQTASSPTTTP